ncbi:hypothetical protein VNI00_010064 [Paramarasmius palmivorus]|uniref:Uncharacterized protein n=1 Tax=Paramarasmius palmivorus TaxID=297713 RepID=A0AAW0CIX7_9AGAR
MFIQPHPEDALPLNSTESQVSSLHLHRLHSRLAYPDSVILLTPQAPLDADGEGEPLQAPAEDRRLELGISGETPVGGVIGGKCVSPAFDIEELMDDNDAEIELVPEGSPHPASRGSSLNLGDTWTFSLEDDGEHRGGE